jgi:hypothetical protein
MIEYIKRSLTGAFLLSFLLMALFRVFYCVVAENSCLWYLHLTETFIIIGTGVLLSFLNDRYGLLPERTLWILVCYVWMVSCFPQTYQNPRLYAASLFVAAAVYALVYAAFISGTRSGPFLCAFFITCAGILYTPALFLLIPFIISFVRMVKLSGKDVVAFLGGIIVPVFLVTAVLWFLNNDIQEYWTITFAFFKGPDPSTAFTSFTISRIVLVSLIFLLVILSLFIRLVHRDTTTTVTISRFYGSMFWIIFFAALVMVFYPVYAKGMLPLVMIPASLLITSLFSERRLFASRVWLALFLLAGLAHYIFVFFPVDTV